MRAAQIAPAAALLAAAGCSLPDDVELDGGGRVREQFEHFRNREFGAAEPADDSYLLHRLQLRGEARVGNEVAALVELVNAVSTQDTPKTPIDEDVIDVLRAQLDWTPGFAAGSDLRIRGGRQELMLGRGRLVSSREGPNVRRAFDGGRITVGDLDRHGVAVDAFALAPIDLETGAFDDGFVGSEQLFGGQVALPLDRDALVVELYYLGRNRNDAALWSSAGRELRHTFGGRLAGDLGPLGLDLELIGQGGRIGDDSIAAFAASAIVEHEITGLPWRPRPGVRLDWISGDHDPNDGKCQTFDALCPNNSYFNEAALFAPSNLRSVIPTLGFRPAERVTLHLLWDFAWRDSIRDSIYVPPGVPGFDADATDARFVGHSFTATGDWRIRDDLALTFAFTHFHAGPAVTEAGGRDVDYVAAWVNFWF